MRKTLLTLTALAGLVGAGVVSSASAAPAELIVAPAASLVQPVQYYYGGNREDWRAREWRHREWERHRHWEEWHRYHRGW